MRVYAWCAENLKPNGTTPRISRPPTGMSVQLRVHWPKYPQKYPRYVVQSRALSASMVPIKHPQAPCFVRFGSPTLEAEVHLYRRVCVCGREPQTPAAKVGRVVEYSGIIGSSYHSPSPQDAPPQPKPPHSSGTARRCLCGIDLRGFKRGTALSDSVIVSEFESG